MRRKKVGQAGLELGHGQAEIDLERGTGVLLLGLAQQAEESAKIKRRLVLHEPGFVFVNANVFLCEGNGDIEVAKLVDHAEGERLLPGDDATVS